MNNSPESTENGIVPVLSISPMEEDHFFLQNILSRLQSTLDPSRTFKVSSCTTLTSGLAALGKRQFELHQVVVFVNQASSNQFNESNISTQ